VVLEAFGDSELVDVLSWLQREVPEVTDVEVGVGGYAPHSHCDVALLLANAQSRAAWLDQITAHGLRVGALNAWGNPLHPDEHIAQQHDADLRNAIRLAALLGVDRVVAMAGCPAADPRDKVPHFGAGGWLPYLEDVYERQWEQAIGPYWADLAAFAAAENPDVLVCLELHPGTAAFNVETFERVAGLGASLAANLDPSHFFWMGMDGHKVAERLGRLVGHSHGKDTVFHADSLALNGLLDRRWPKPAEQMPWNFAVVGRGHDPAWWTGLMRSLAASRVQVVSIEHEDPFVPPKVGIPEAARLLKDSIEAAQEVGT
jgi:sugar phosphate isomerase/epimerase